MANTRRRSESEAYWRSAIDQQRHSGLSVRQFCIGQRISQSSFHYWNRKLGSRQGGSARQQSPSIVPVDVVADEDAIQGAVIDITTARGITLRCPANLEGSTITSILNAILASSPAKGESC